MKKITLTLAVVFACFLTFAQQFSDNFDSYTSGSFLGPQSPFWTTGSGIEGGDADALVSSINTYSSANSIYLHDQTNNGTAQLIRLDVGQVFEEGVFTFETALNVSAGQSAIISLMGNTSYNSLYTFHCEFTAGQATPVSVSGGNNVNLPVFSYPQGTWFRFKVEANLTLHLWKVYVNENLVGLWTNPVNKIACIDFCSAYTSTVNYEFYIDNVQFIHQNYSLSNLNAIVSLVKMDKDLLGEQVSTQVNVLNAGEVPINSFDLNLFYQNQIIPMTFSGLNIQSLDTWSFEVPGVVLAPGDQSYIVKITNVNGVLDDILDDNILSGVVSPIVPAPGKMVVGEEITGTWCPFCPSGIVNMNLFKEKYDPYWCGIVIHYEDPMALNEYRENLYDWTDGFPSAVIDRTFGAQVSNMYPDFYTRIQIPPVATIVNGATWDSITRLLHVSVTSNFVLPAYGNYKVACVLTEDDVTGSGAGWAQSNAYASGNYGVMGGFETLSQPVPSTTMVYDHVARVIAPSFYGMPNSFPNNVEAGDSYTTSITFTLPAEWDETKINIIGMIMDPSGKIDNAGRATIAEAVANGYVGSTLDIPATDLTQVMTVSPNPASTSVTVNLQIAQASNVSMKLVDFSGKVLSERAYGAVQGHYDIQINTSNYKAGVYFVELNLDGRTTAKKLIIE
ncbi:MAG: hypothetical protein RLZZ531_1863 [Bacteroidota bacterium]|jgi:hypothetical protein